MYSWVARCACFGGLGIDPLVLVLLVSLVVEDGCFLFATLALRFYPLLHPLPGWVATPPGLEGDYALLPGIGRKV